MWDGELDAEYIIPVTLTVESGVTVILDNTNWCVGDGAILVNNGCITTVEESYGGVQIENGGSYLGDGQVFVDLRICYQEDMLESDLYIGYSGYTVAVEDGAVYTVKNDVDIRTVYNISDDTEIVVFGHLGELSGAAVENANNFAIVRSFAGLRAGDKAWYNDRRVFNDVYLGDDYRIEIREDLVLDGNVGIWSNTGFIIPYGVTLTVNGWLHNDGDISVDGTLVITDHGGMHNNRNLTVGALFGDEVGRIVVYGYLGNGNYMHLYATGQLLKGSEQAYFDNWGILVEDHGSVRQFP